MEGRGVLDVHRGGRADGLGLAVGLSVCVGHAV